MPKRSQDIPIIFRVASILFSGGKNQGRWHLGSGTSRCYQQKCESNERVILLLYGGISAKEDHFVEGEMEAEKEKNISQLNLKVNQEDNIVQLRTRAWWYKKEGDFGVVGTKKNISSGKSSNLFFMCSLGCCVVAMVLLSLHFLQNVIIKKEWKSQRRNMTLFRVFGASRAMCEMWGFLLQKTSEYSTHTVHSCKARKKETRERNRFREWWWSSPCSVWSQLRRSFQSVHIKQEKARTRVQSSFFVYLSHVGCDGTVCFRKGYQLTFTCEWNTHSIWLGTKIKNDSLWQVWGKLLDSQISQFQERGNIFLENVWINECEHSGWKSENRHKVKTFSLTPTSYLIKVGNSRYFMAGLWMVHVNKEIVTGSGEMGEHNTSGGQ